MNGQSGPLNELRDIHLPDPISWWPPAPGWWIAVCLTIGCVLLAIWAIRRWRGTTAYRSARHELQGLRETYAANRQNHKLVSGLSILLRRYAMALYGREQVAGLTGHKWLSFLDQKGKTRLFTDGVGNVLVSIPYGGQEPVNGEKLITAVELWLKGHRKGKP